MLGSSRLRVAMFRTGRAYSASSLVTDIELRSAVRGSIARRRTARRRRHYLISGNSLYWWNGGGDGSVHSSVVAPAPHGLSAAFCLRRKACATPKKNTNAPNAETYEPSDETRFQPAKASG